MTRILFALILPTLAMLAGTLPAMAQGLFTPRVIVNERVVTNYEYEQRLRMLTLFGAPGNREAEALKGLIDDRLREGAALALGIAATEEDVRTGMTEFAARANLSAEEFIAALNQAGVQTETFRDFVLAGILWREVVRARFLPRAQITETEIDRALAQSSGTAAVRVLLSEIIIPAPPGQEAAARARAERIRTEARGEAGFAAAARRFSAAGSASRGGRLDWIPIANLPPALAGAVLGLGPGGVSQPIDIQGAVALFQLRAIEETASREPASVVVEYAEFYLPEGPNALAQAEAVRQQVDTCDDLYGVAEGLPEERLTRTSATMGEVPQDVGLELARLDANEISTAIVRGGARVVLMLCGRNPQIEEAPTRDAIRDQLRNQRLAAYADGYLEELRADAIIREP
jgi:peptidyl-prolyl cis-trans isomerase SurA